MQLLKIQIPSISEKIHGWNSWIDTSISNVKIAEDNTTVIITVKGSDIAAGGWGSWDDFYINKTSTDDESGSGDNGSTGNNNFGSTQLLQPHLQPIPNQMELPLKTKPKQSQMEQKLRQLPRQRPIALRKKPL